MPRSAAAVDPQPRNLRSGLLTPAAADLGLDPGLGLGRNTQRYNYYTPGAVTFTAFQTGWHDFYLYGGGGNGGSSPGTEASDGGGGGAAKKRMWLFAGQTVSLVVGASSGTTTATFPDGLVVSAQDGGNGRAGYEAGGSGGTGVNGDINRTGGRGHGWDDNDNNPDTNDGGSISAQPGEFGGAANGGGGGAGFTDEGIELAGNGGGGFPGGGGQGNDGGAPGDPGGSGAVVVIGPRP